MNEEKVSFPVKPQQLTQKLPTFLVPLGITFFELFARPENGPFGTRRMSGPYPIDYDCRMTSAHATDAEEEKDRVTTKERDPNAPPPDPNAPPLTIANTATVSSTSADPVSGNNEATAITKRLVKHNPALLEMAQKLRSAFS